jgi:hypothetical protein
LPCKRFKKEKKMNLKEMDTKELFFTACSEFSIMRSNNTDFEKYKDELLRRLEEGEKALKLIDSLIVEFQDSMDEKLFYTLIKEYMAKAESYSRR